MCAEDSYGVTIYSETQEKQKLNPFAQVCMQKGDDRDTTAWQERKVASDRGRRDFDDDRAAGNISRQASPGDIRGSHIRFDTATTELRRTNTTARSQTAHTDHAGDIVRCCPDG